MLKENNNILFRIVHACAFFPFIGWLLPLYLYTDNTISQNNAKTGMLLAFHVFVVYAVLIFVDFFVPTTIIIVSFIISTCIYALLLIYFIILIAGVVFTQLGKEFKLPFITAKALGFNI